MGSEKITEWHLKMADFPFGSELIGQMPEIGKDKDWNTVLESWPTVKKNNCFIMSARHARPGISRDIMALT